MSIRQLKPPVAPSIGFRIIATIALLTCSVTAWAQPALQTVSLEQLLARAARHPEVMIAGADIEIASGAVVAADRAPLPAVSASIGSVDLQNGIGPGSWVGGKRLDKALGVDWVWERGDKRLHRTRQAERSLDAAAFDRGDVLLARRIAISAAFWELLAAQDREVDSSIMLRSAEQMANASRQRLEKGDISEQEAARVFIETERTRSDYTALRGARHLAAESLAQTAALATDRIEAQAGWPELPAAIRLNQVQQSGQGSPYALMSARELDELLNNRADVRAARSRLEAARAALDLARALQVPDSCARLAGCHIGTVRLPGIATDEAPGATSNHDRAHPPVPNRPPSARFAQNSAGRTVQTRHH